MPPKANRLKFKEFEKLFKTGRRFHSAAATFIVQASSETRLAVVAGRKISNRAVVRNRFRRVSYHTIFPFLKDKPLAVIVLLKPEVKKLTTAEFRLALSEMSRRILNSQ